MADVFYRATFQYTQRNETCFTSLAFFGHATPNPTLNDVADAIMVATGLKDKMRSVLTVLDTLDSLLVRELLAPDDTAVPSEVVRSIAQAGLNSAGDDMLPNAVSGLLHVATNAAVRSGHGRMWLPSPRASAAAAADGTFNMAAGYGLGVTALITELGHYNRGGSRWTTFGADFGAGVYSRTRRLRGETNFAFQATAYSLRPRWHWLRKRAG